MGVKVTPELKEGIRKAILDLGSQDEVAKAVNVSKTAINRYLNRDVEIRPSNYKRLIEVVGKYVEESKPENKSENKKSNLGVDENLLIELYGKLDDEGKKKMLNILIDFSKDHS